MKLVIHELNQSWDALSTLTPAEYSSFRDDLGASSGFQSYQYPTVEFLLGNKDAVKMEPHRHRAEVFLPSNPSSPRQPLR